MFHVEIFTIHSGRDETLGSWAGVFRIGFHREVIGVAEGDDPAGFYQLVAQIALRELQQSQTAKTETSAKSDDSPACLE